MRRSTFLGGVIVALTVLVAGPALATDCVNASKPQAAGAQIVFDESTGQIEYASPGVINRIERALIDLDTGEGIHGILGLDFDGDGTVDVSTWFGVGPTGYAIAEQARENGPACHGITDFETYLSQCVEFPG